MIRHDLAANWQQVQSYTLGHHSMTLTRNLNIHSLVSCCVILLKSMCSVLSLFVFLLFYN